ncbi:hypothetical protein CRG98_014950 [Punica granatum]|uniref:Uncharacterized protein n=1 Tax=Punica granatum TaxID=22663 RepID=A0A2I0K7Y6_PUNGR|nr:hypothetical protein CRG98_014950 [Punica granatum]
MPSRGGESRVVAACGLSWRGGGGSGSGLRGFSRGAGSGCCRLSWRPDRCQLASKTTGTTAVVSSPPANLSEIDPFNRHYLHRHDLKKHFPRKRPMRLKS